MDRGRAEKGLSDEKNFIRELTEKNLLLTAALEGVPEMIFLRDAAGRFLMCNRYATEFLGSAPEPIVHKSFRELLGDCAAGLDELHERVMRSGQAAVKDDLKKERSTFSATCNPCFGADGSLIGSACFLRDVTDSLETSLELQSGRDRLEMAAQVSGIGIWDYDIAHDVLICDNRWYEIMGRDPEHPVTDINSWKKWIHPDDAQRATEVNLSSLREMLARKENYAISFRIVRPNGEIRWVRSAACLIDGGTGTPRRVVGVVFDVTENRLEFTRLERLSLQDPLTELLNRRGFDQSLTSACEQALHDGDVLSVAMIDVDYFKQYNDHYGHGCGDDTLKQVAHTIAEALRPALDQVARYGGEEFAILMPGTANPGDVLEDIRSRVEQLGIEHKYSRVSTYITVSCGGVVGDENSLRHPQQLLAMADQALYQAKREGRNCKVIRTL